jgi:hypothetical protein
VALVILVCCGKIGRAIQSILFFKVFVLSCCFQNDLNTQFNQFKNYSLSINLVLSDPEWLGGLQVGGLGHADNTDYVEVKNGTLETFVTAA